MKPSCPGILFVGGFLITHLVSLLVDLFRFSIFSKLILRRLQILRNLSISSMWPNLLSYHFSHDPLYFCAASCNFSFSISDLIYLILLFFLVSPLNICQFFCLSFQMTNSVSLNFSIFLNLY